MSPAPRLLFVCSGNLCRSTMAMYLARDRAERRDLRIEVDSAGTLGLVGRPPPRPVLAVMREVDILVDDHRSKGVSPALLEWADRVLVMTTEHAVTLRERFPDIADHVELLGPYGGQAPEIADPMGRWKPFHRKVRRQIEGCVDGLLERLSAPAP
jgi:protein-tyrosine-phosphatase